MKERCREILEYAYLYIDDEMTQTQRIEFEAHLEECGPCYERVGLDREIAVLVSRRASHPTPCPARLKARIHSLLEDL